MHADTSPFSIKQLSLFSFWTINTSTVRTWCPRTYCSFMSSSNGIKPNTKLNVCGASAPAYVTSITLPGCELVPVKKHLSNAACKLLFSAQLPLQCVGNNFNTPEEESKLQYEEGVEWSHFKKKNKHVNVKKRSIREKKTWAKKTFETAEAKPQSSSSNGVFTRTRRRWS